MDRRQFLSLSAKRQPAVKATTTGSRTDSGISAYTGSFDTAQAVHLLKRTMFGSTPADINWVKGLGMDAAVEALLTTVTPVTSQPLNIYGEDEHGVPMGETWVNTPPPSSDDEDNKRWNSYKAWWIGVMINQGRSIQEKMVLFWHNHFVTEMDMTHDSRYTYKYNTTLRSLATGNFKALTKAITLDPAMLRYLNGYLNSKEGADENYARELHELFTVGKGPDSHYTEEDVRATARVLTGFRINADTQTTYFESTAHDIENKEFSDFYSNKKITGKTGQAGATELDDLLNIIFAQPECAKFIVRKLYRWFVYYLIDDAVETNVITPLAEIFRANNYDLLPVLRALFKSEHFYDPLNMSALIKNPIDHNVGLVREFGVVYPTAYMDAYDAWDRLRSHASSMLMDLGEPPQVAGWVPYYQEPQFHEMWINTDTLPKRNQLTDAMISEGGFNGVHIDVLAFAKRLSDPSDPVKLVSDSLDILYRMGVSDKTKAWMKNTILLSGQNPDSDYYWTEAWTAYLAAPGDMAARQIVEGRLRTLYKYLMNLSEYQLS